jgi:pyridoxal phosphate enzyme (YggS family)
VTGPSASGPDRAGVAAHLAEVRERIAGAARAAGRAPEEIQLVAVSKEVDASAVAEAIAAGQHDFGENRAQELATKVEALREQQSAPVWHFIGRLQRNKIKAIAAQVSLWHSVDRTELGSEIARHAPGARVLVQVNVSGEQQKGGCEPGEVPALIATLVDQGLAVEGLMTVPPLAGDPRPHFAGLRELAAREALPVLSMGMSGDFEAAIAEGSTLVRVGRAVFGPRP